jgi:hypothetical protein
VYGPVRTVVWQGSAGDRRPYADLTGKQEATDYFLLADVAQRDFAKRFGRGKLSFTGDVLQVISVFGRQQKFAKLLKRLTVGA